MTIRRRTILLSTVATATAGWPQLGVAQAAGPVGDFLALSARLTGFPVSALSAGVGAMLLKSFQAQGAQPGPGQLAANTTRSPALDAEIIAAWYSGVSQTAAGPVVVTHDEALVWHSADFLHPRPMRRCIWLLVQPSSHGVSN